MDTTNVAEATGCNAPCAAKGRAPLQGPRLIKLDGVLQQIGCSPMCNVSPSRRILGVMHCPWQTPHRRHCSHRLLAGSRPE